MAIISYILDFQSNIYSVAHETMECNVNYIKLYILKQAVETGITGTSYTERY